MIHKVFTDYYRCPEMYADFWLKGDLAPEVGYFRFGTATTCYGQNVKGVVANAATDLLHDILNEVEIAGNASVLPFNLSQIIDNLRYERYCNASMTLRLHEQLIKQIYYVLRAVMPVSFRKYLQRVYLSDWQKIPFPNWPVDRTVDQLFEQLLLSTMQTHGVDTLPFIWFWPDGYQGCMILTHDVETAAGRDFCSRLMDINESYGLRSSFQVIPEKRYEVPQTFLNSIKRRGFEVNLHGLHHDDRLFREREKFLLRAQRINQYLKEYEAVGFRSPLMFRNLDWYEYFEFSYDMSVPNVAHLDPQRGGCCTVMPYFIGNILELPLTTTQDYSLFHILGEYSLDLWKTQLQLILEKHGLVSFLVHPDYIRSEKPLRTYETLLAYVVQFCKKQKVWRSLPKEVDAWWRQRSQMKLVLSAGTWQIEGAGSEHAKVAYARRTGKTIVYDIDNNSGKNQAA